MNTYESWIVEEHGGPEVLKRIDAPLCAPEPDGVRLRVTAAGVAFGDVWHRTGMPGSFKLPYRPGYDVVGTLDQVGEKVSGLAVGQSVAALPLQGGYGQYAYAKAGQVVPLPDGVNAAEAVALVLNYLTAYQMLHRVVRITADQVVLVHGAAGGVGSALVELARLAGARVIGTASSGKHEWVARLGASPIDYRSQDFVSATLELAKDGVDAAFDPIGGDNWSRTWRCMKPTGHLVVYGASSTVRQHGRGFIRGILGLKARSLLSRRRVSVYSVAHPRTHTNAHFTEDLSKLVRLLAEKTLHPLIGATLPLAEAPRAQSLLESGAVAGKIVLLNAA